MLILGPSLGPSLEPLLILLVLVIVFSILYQFRHIFYDIRYRFALRPVEKDEESPSKPRMGKTCPRCGGVMEEGYLVGPRGMYWSQDPPPPIPHRFPSVPRLDFRSDPASVLSGIPFLGTPYFKASKCGKCGIILLDTKSREY